MQDKGRAALLCVMTMTRENLLETLKQAQAELRAQGVVRAALFSSVARNEARADSDIDIMVEIDPAAKVDLLGYVGDRADY